MANPLGLNKKRNRYHSVRDGLVHAAYACKGRTYYAQRCNGLVVAAVSESLAVTCFECMCREVREYPP